MSQHCRLFMSFLLLFKSNHVAITVRIAEKKQKMTKKSPGKCSRSITCQTILKFFQHSLSLKACVFTFCFGFNGVWKRCGRPRLSWKEIFLHARTLACCCFGRRRPFGAKYRLRARFLQSCSYACNSASAIPQCQCAILVIFQAKKVLLQKQDVVVLFTAATWSDSLWP